MASFEQLKNNIRQYIKQNGDREITGNILQEILLGVVDAIDMAKVDKVEGKGLSTNDFTTALKNKLTSLIDIKTSDYDSDNDRITIGSKVYQLVPYVPAYDYYVGYFNDNGWSSNSDFANLTGEALVRMATGYMKSSNPSITRTIVAADTQANDPDQRREILFVMWRSSSAPTGGTMNLGLGEEQLSAGDIDGTATEPKFKTSSHDIVAIDGVDYTVSGLRAKFEINNSVTFNFQ